MKSNDYFIKTIFVLLFTSLLFVIKSFSNINAADTIRINTGGGTYVDSLNNTWSADNYFNTGYTYQTIDPIANTNNQALYQTERWDPLDTTEMEYAIPVTNADYEVYLHFAEILYTNPGQRQFDVYIENTKVLDHLDIVAEAGPKTALIKSFPVTVSDGVLNIKFVHQIENPKISAIEVIPAAVQLAHAVAGPDQTLVDINKDGVETATLDGSQSHTHAFGQSLNSWIWTEGTKKLASTAIAQVTLPLGVHNITLTVTDTAGNTASDDLVVNVVSPILPGLIGYYYDFSSTQNLGNLPDFTNLKPTWGQIESDLNTDATAGAFRGTPYVDYFASQYMGSIQIDQAGTYGFALQSDDGVRLYIDGIMLINQDGLHGMDKATATTNLSAGSHSILIQYFEATGNAGLKFFWTKPGQVEEIVPQTALFHDHSTIVPVINSINPTFGPLTGGNQITLSGLGFVFPANAITIQIGTNNLTGSAVTIVDDKTINVVAPAGNGAVTINAQTTNGASNYQNYTYSQSAPPAVNFTAGTLSTPFIDGPSSLAFGPDRKLYVGTQFGEIWTLTLDDNFNVVNSQVSTVIKDNDTSKNILGIAFNPLNTDPANPKLYISHSHLFHGGTDPYSGKISIMSGTNLQNKNTIITGLPVSDHDHGVNGMTFGQNGELYIQVGGETNAGIPDPALGNLDEKKFSAGTMVAHIERPNFNGNITYDSSGNQTGGMDVENYADGFRNPFDIVFHSNGNLYGTDNGPNLSFGKASTSCTTDAPDPEGPDEINLIVKGKYYGHPNRFRGQANSEECIFHLSSEPSTSTYTAPLATVPSSTDGLMEYTANTFAGQLKGHLIAAKWNKALYDLTLTSDGQNVAANKKLTDNGGLDVAQWIDGTIFVADNIGDVVTYNKPQEPAPNGLYITAVFPAVGPSSGGNKLLISGYGFDSTIKVSIKGNDCPVATTSATRIECTAPGGAVGIADITLTSSSDSKTLTNAYRYIDSGQKQITRINVGGGAYTDSQNNVWQQDNYFNTGSSYTTTDTITGTTDPTLFQTERWDDPTLPELSYSIPVANGKYTVNLGFAEIFYNSAGTRVFDVQVEGQTVLSNFDIYSEAGGKDKALIKTINATVTDGVLNITLIHKIENPKLSSIEVLPATSISPIRVNAGGQSFIDSLNQTWSADTNFNTGNTFTTASTISGTTNQALYQTERWDDSTAPEMEYSFNVPNGSYKVVLHFAEIYYSTVGSRVFDVAIEGVTAFSNVDIVNEAGGKNIALQKQYTANVTDGQLNIQFIHKIENPKISGIEIIPL